MQTKEIILKLRTKSGLSQDELPQKVFVKSQTVIKLTAYSCMVRRFCIYFGGECAIIKL